MFKLTKIIKDEAVDLNKKTAAKWIKERNKKNHLSNNPDKHNPEITIYDIEGCGIRYFYRSELTEYLNWDNSLWILYNWEFIQTEIENMSFLLDSSLIDNFEKIKKWLTDMILSSIKKELV